MYMQFFTSRIVEIGIDWFALLCKSVLSSSALRLKSKQVICNFTRIHEPNHVSPNVHVLSPSHAHTAFEVPGGRKERYFSDLFSGCRIHVSDAHLKPFLDWVVLGFIRHV